MRQIKRIEMVEPNLFTDPKIAIVYQSRVIDTLLVDERETEKHEKYTVVSSDISFLINQQKLMRFRPEDVRAIVDNYTHSSTPLSDALKGMSDEKIVETVKSRYIQSPADMRSYAENLSRSVREFMEDLQANLNVDQSDQTSLPGSSEAKE